ncbi:hypothetical protein Bca4012_065863 [Brassica carinata]
MPTLETPNSRGDTTHLHPMLDWNGAARQEARDTQILDIEESDSKPKPDKETPEEAAATRSSVTSYLEQILSKKFDTIQSMVERLSKIDHPPPPPMPRKFSFPSIKMYDGKGDPDDHIAQYKQRMLAVALPRELRGATM